MTAASAAPILMGAMGGSRYRPERLLELARAHLLVAQLLDWPHPTSQQWLALRKRPGSGDGE